MISSIFSSLGISDIFYLSILFVVTYVARYYFNYFTRPNPLPGPFPLPFFGNAHQSLGIGYNDWLLSMHKKYGDMYEVDVGQRMIVLCRADLIEKMNVPSAKTKYPYRWKTTEGFLEYGLEKSALAFSSDLKAWKFNRPIFARSMMTPSFNYQAIEWTSELWGKMEYYWNKLEDKELDLTSWIRRFTTDVIFRIATGEKSDCLTSYFNTFIHENNDPISEKKNEESDRLIHSLEKYLAGVSYYLIFNKIMRHYFPVVREQGKSLLKNRDYLFDRLLKMIKKRRIEIDNTPLNQPLDNDILTSCLIANTPRDVNYEKDDDSSRPMTDEEIFGNILDSMLGGTDTTANLLIFVVYYLAHNPEVKQRFQQELVEVLGKDLKPITFKDLEELQYCEAIIKEVYRHCPVFFMNGRVNAEDDNIGGYNWSKGTTFQMLYSAIMMRKDYWTDPEKFDPDRFYKVEESDKYLLEKQKIKNSFTIFGDGIRICPGRKLAMIELKYLLASIYRKYDIELVDMNAPLKYKSELLNYSEELIVKVKTRNF